MEPTQRELNRIPDIELYQFPVPELHKLIRKLEAEKLSLASDHANMMKEINKRMQIHLLEIRGLKDVNQRLQDDSQELRNLCVFLDDDRQKSRKLAREWQRFGRYTSSVMKSEVSAYQEKLKELELRQNDLLRENIELKELCLYLDEERSNKNLNTSDSRDQGDGSSISSLTNERTDDVTISEKMTSPMSKSHETQEEEQMSPSRSTINDHTTQYIQYLENHIRTLEDQLTQMDIRIPSKDWSTPMESDQTGGSSDGGHSLKSPSKPEAVVHAMKSLDAREKLEQIADGHYDDGLDEMEKAVLRQMCQVAKRKLEKDPSPDKQVQRGFSERNDQSPRTNPNFAAGDVKFVHSNMNQSSDDRYSSNEYYPDSLQNHARQLLQGSVSGSYSPREYQASFRDFPAPRQNGSYDGSEERSQRMTGPESGYQGPRTGPSEYQGQRRGLPEYQGQGMCTPEYSSQRMVLSGYQDSRMRPVDYQGQSAGPLEHQGPRMGPLEHQGQRMGPLEHQGQRMAPLEHQGQRMAPPEHQGQRICPPEHQGQRMGPPEHQSQRMGPPEHQGQRMGPPEHQGQRMVPPEHQGQRMVPPEHRGQLVGPPEHQGQRIGPPEHQGQRVGPPEHQGQRVVAPQHQGQRVGPPEHQGQRVGPPEHQGQRVGPPEYQGQRVGPPEYQGQRVGAQEYQGQRMVPPEHPGPRMGPPEPIWGQRVCPPEHQGVRMGPPEHQGQRVGPPEHQGLRMGTPSFQAQRMGTPQYLSNTRFGNNPQQMANFGYQSIDRRQAPRQ